MRRIVPALQLLSRTGAIEEAGTARKENKGHDEKDRCIEVNRGAFKPKLKLVLKDRGEHGDDVLERSTIILLPRNRTDEKSKHPPNLEL